MLNGLQKDALHAMSLGDRTISGDTIDVICDVITDLCDNFMEFGAHHPECPLDPECQCGFESAIRYVIAISDAING